MADIKTKNNLLIPLSLRKNFTWTFFGNVIYAASQWCILIIIAKIGSPELVGRFALGLAISAPVVLFTNMNLRAIQATDAKDEYAFNEYFGLRSITVITAIIIILFITLFTKLSFETSLVIILIGIAKGIEAISDIFYGLIQKNERMDRIAISMLIKGPLSVVLFALGLFFSDNLCGGLVGLIISWLIVLLFYDMKNGCLLLSNSFDSHLKLKLLIIIKPQWRWSIIRKLILLSLPLGYVMMLTSLNINIPRYFIEQHFGEHQLGIFAALIYLMVVGNLIIRALGQSASPRLAKMYAANKKKSFIRIVIRLCGIGIVLGLTGILIAYLAGKEILILLYTKEYGNHAYLLIWIMVTALIMYIASFLGYGMTAARYFKIQGPLFTIVILVNLISGYILIPRYGLMGAITSIIFSSITQVLGSLSVIIFSLLSKKEQLSKQIQVISEINSN